MIDLSLRSLAAVLFLAVPIVAAQGQGSPTTYERPLSDRRVTYDIVANLDTEARSIDGVERITWRNTDRVAVDELQFHLYLNAFSGPKTTFMRESRGVFRGHTAADADPWGRVDITSLRILDEAERPPGDFASVSLPSWGEAGLDLTHAIEFIRPDDGNEDDFTVMRVKLPESVLPGETITLNVEFTSKLPEIVARTGWKRKEDGSLFFMAGQWYPKLGVYEVPGQRYVSLDAEKGRWNTHQFHQNSEFYADFGSFRVAMTVPENYVVGASGVLVAESRSDGRKTLVHEAEDVHDFGWTASPAFRAFHDSWKHVRITVLLQPEHVGQLQRHLDAATLALQYFDEWYGEYPYTTLTIVDGVGDSNGMEYPTLITAGTLYGLPERLRILELTVIHEFAHQYFYGMLGSNEFEEAWLDEGISSYAELKIMDTAYGEGAVLDFPGWRFSNAEMQRVSYAHHYPTRGRIFMNSWEYDSFGTYATQSYAKPATVLLALEHYVGDETMQRLLRTYADRWRFRHPTTRDFIDVANEIAGQDLSWFFDQFIYGSAAIDYSVEGISNKTVTGLDSAETTLYDARVVLQRKEEGYFPVDVVVTFDDGHRETLHWDGRDKWRTYTFRGPSKVSEVFIDPDDRVPLDIDRSNNRRIVGSHTGVATKYGLKFIVWIQQFFQLLGGLI